MQAYRDDSSMTSTRLVELPLCLDVSIAPLGQNNKQADYIYRESLMNWL